MAAIVAMIAPTTTQTPGPNNPSSGAIIAKATASTKQITASPVAALRKIGRAGGFSLFGISSFLSPNGSDQWLAARGQPSLPDDARESICIAWFRASHPDGAAVHTTPGNATGATGSHANADCPPLGHTGPIEEGDD